MTNNSLLYLSADDVRQALPMSEAISAMGDAFTALSGGQVTMPVRASLPVPDQQGVGLVMPCYSAEAGLFSLKTVTVFADNPGRGLPTIQALLILTDGVTGVHQAILEGASVTAIRTGAASGLATDLLARPDASAVSVIGAGVQARTQLEAVCTVRRVARASVFDLDREAADRFATEMTNQLGLPVSSADSSADCLADTDVICTATSSQSPVLRDEELPPGVHINAVGAYRPDMAEIPPAIVCQARIVVDHHASALDEAGDLLQTMQQGRIEAADFETELGDVLLNRARGRSSPDEVTLFKSVGVAIQDLYAASRALANARRLGLGIPLE